MSGALRGCITPLAGEGTRRRRRRSGWAKKPASDGRAGRTKLRSDTVRRGEAHALRGISSDEEREACAVTL